MANGHHFQNRYLLFYLIKLQKLREQNLSQYYKSQRSKTVNIKILSTKKRNVRSIIGTRMSES